VEFKRDCIVAGEESITFAPTYRFAKGPQAAYVIDKAKTTWVSDFNKCVFALDVCACI
jgi:hypothetical protein